MNIHGARRAGRSRRKAYMGWSWAAACGVQGRGILRWFPHSLLFDESIMVNKILLRLLSRQCLGPWVTLSLPPLSNASDWVERLATKMTYNMLTGEDRSYSLTDDYVYQSSSSSSSDRVDSRGPLRQPGVATTTSLGPFSTNAEGCTVTDLLDPWMARASWPSPPTRTKMGAGSCCCYLW